MLIEVEWQKSYKGIKDFVEENKLEQEFFKITGTTVQVYLELEDEDYINYSEEELIFELLENMPGQYLYTICCDDTYEIIKFKD